MKFILLGFILLFFSENLFAKEQIITKIPEASGISYCKNSNTLFVVGDEGYLYEVNLNGKILREKRIGDYDFEGITIDEKNDLLLIAVEGKENILILSRKKFKIKNEISIKREFKGKKILKKGKDGIEGITLYKKHLYLSNQSNKRYPEEDSSVIVIVDYDKKSKKQKIKDIIDHGYKDIAGLSFYNDILYMISDKDSLLIKYDINKNKTIKEYKLNPIYAQEGITFDKDGNLYIADDNGQVLKIEDFDK